MAGREDRAGEIASLRAQIAALERGGEEGKAAAIPLQVEAIDACLPWGGLPSGCLHELVSGHHPDGFHDGAAHAFAALLLGRVASWAQRPVLWVGGEGSRAEPYGPGLAALGLPPEHLLFVRTSSPTDVLWALEEGTRCRGLAGVLAEVWRLDLVTLRRLHLAARASGLSVFLLNHGEAVGMAATRWRVTSRPSSVPLEDGVGPWRWHLELLRCRGRALDEGGRVGQWEVEASNETGGLCLAAADGDRKAASSSPPVRGPIPIPVRWDGERIAG